MQFRDVPYLWKKDRPDCVSISQRTCVITRPLRLRKPPFFPSNSTFTHSLIHRSSPGGVGGDLPGSRLAGAGSGAGCGPGGGAHRGCLQNSVVSAGTRLQYTRTHAPFVFGLGEKHLLNESNATCKIDP